MANMILRVRTKDGMFRLTVNDGGKFIDVVNQLYEKIGNVDSLSISDKPGDKGKRVEEFGDIEIKEMGLKNGDMLFAFYETGDSGDHEKSTTINTGSINISNPTSGGKTTTIPIAPQELPIDKYLDSQDGLIKRNKSNLCRHGDKGMCEYCAPLPPWDKDYKESQGIKHLSFYAYLKQLNDSKNNRNNATSYMAPLDEPNYAVDKKCTAGHLPYPKGICSKCQPSVISLQQQSFRMVDHVMFSDSSILNRFIDSWRSSGTQRYGVLYGSYESYDKVPLGIKANVEFIYEPPQSDELDGLTLLDWSNEKDVDALAAQFGLYKVGVIFTDLTDSGMKNGTVLCKRHKDSYFLSCLEVLMAGRNQLKYRNQTKYSNSKEFSSKFVTCVVSGGLNGDIEPRSYQVSVNAEALIKADVITSSTQPSMMYINESNNERYVPDVFYSKINEYGLEVKTNAKPAFPIDYLLVTLSDSFPLEPKPLFNSSHGYIIENREFLGESQNLSTLYKHLNNDIGDGKVLFDFHLLMYLYSTNILHKEEWELIVKFVKSGDKEDFMKLIESPGWMSLITILENSS